MDVDSSLNESLINKRRSSRRGRPRTANIGVSGHGIYKESEDEATSSGDGDQSDDKSRIPKLTGMKRKRSMSRSGLVKRSRLGKHRMSSYSHTVRPVFEKPLRRSQREKRLLFATFNVSQMDKQILNRAPDTDMSEDEMDPYEKLLSPHRVTRNSSRLRVNTAPSIASGSANKMAATQDNNAASSSPSKAEDSSGEKAGEGDEEGEEVSEEPSEEDEGGYYNLRKRQPVIYHLKPVHHVVESVTPPKKRRGRRRRSLSRHRASYHSKARAAAPRAYQGRQAGHGGGQSPRKRQAHNDSSSTSSDSDSDEAKFRRRKCRSMAKARSQCLPMNFNPEDLTSQGVIRDRIQIGASLADVNPMNVDRSVTFHSIGGLKRHIRALKEMIIFPLLYPEVFDRFQISPPRGVLFHGPPGCGKTLVARALANECSKGGKKVAFFMRKGADCLSKWVGESERQLRLLFDQAYQVRPSIIFFDEIDGLAPVRSSRQDQIHSSIVSTLLALMDGLDSRGEIVVIGATNRIDAIDPALRRPGRFDREFIFPLPSREDRHSILSIHTKAWNPRLKETFLSELSNSTVGYCGADLRALCTEAALFALRRKYPQIYSAKEKLVLDTSKINIAAADFHNALKSIVPTAQRSDGAVALALPEHVRPLYLQSLADLLNLLCFVFPPSWQLVSKAGGGLEPLLMAERAVMSSMERRLEILSSSPVGVAGAVNAQALSATPNTVDMGARESRYMLSTTAYARKGLGHASKQLARKTRSVYSAKKVGRGGGGMATSDRSRSTSVGGSCSGRSNSGTACVATSSVYNQLFLKHSKSVSLGSVFFDLTEVSSGDSEQMMAGDGSGDRLSRLSNTILVDGSEPSVGELCSGLQSTSFLSVSSHPHSPPSVHHPRLVLCGQPGMGQSTYLGPALLHALEDLPVRTMDLTTLCGAATPEEACAQMMRELRRVTPSILFLPRLDSWWEVTSETFQVTLFSSLSSLLPSTPLLILATAECPWEELPAKLKEVFADVGSQTFSVLPPSLDQRKQFFYDVLLEKPFHPPPSRPKLVSDVPLEELAVASPPKPRELTKHELGHILKQREAVLRELRVFLRDATNKLLAERKFKEYVKPVDPEEVPDYHDIIAQSMDLSTIMKKIDEHWYTVPKQWIADVDLIAKNALEYNPECDSESRLLRHRAVALQDMAHSFLDHELSEEFEQQCENIAESFERIEKTEAYAQLQLCASLSSTPKGEGSTSAGSFKDDIYSVPRRSLRQKGLRPEGKGFPYYSPSKAHLAGEFAASGSRTEDLSTASQGSDTEVDNRNTRDMDATEDDGFLTSPDTGVAATVAQTALKCDLTNSNVRRQIIRPWEDDTGHHNGIMSPPGSSLDSAISLSYKGTQERAPHSVQTAAEALVAMATPTKEAHHHQRENGVGEPVPMDSDQELSYPRRRTNSVRPNVDESVLRGITSPPPPPPPPPHEKAQVSVDGKALVQLFEKIVMGTESCSVEDMERIHTTYKQLVFRHRMSWQREDLVEDLKLTTDLFLQELAR